MKISAPRERVVRPVTATSVSRDLRSWAMRHQKEETDIEAARARTKPVVPTGDGGADKSVGGRGDRVLGGADRVGPTAS